jgi:hypothetical protein
VHNIPCADADFPSLRFPLRAFVIGKGAGRDGVDGLAAQAAVEQLENEGLACASGRVHDYVLPRSERAHSLLLPQIGERQLLKGRERKWHEPLEAKVARLAGLHAPFRFLLMFIFILGDVRG